MSEFNFSDPSALSPRIDADITQGLMQGISLGAKKSYTDAKAIADKMKQNKLLKIDQMNIHPLYRREAEDIIYNNYAEQIAATRSGQDPTYIAAIGQQKLMDINAKSKRAFDYEKVDPNKNIFDPEAMTKFSSGDIEGARKALQSKYDPQLVEMLDPERNMYAPPKIDIKAELEKNYGYDKNPSLYRAGGKIFDGPFGKKIYEMEMTPQASLAIAKDFASKPEVQANILFQHKDLWNVEYAKSKLKYPKDDAVARGEAFTNVITKLMPSGKEQDSKSLTINNNIGGLGDPDSDVPFFKPSKVSMKVDVMSGTYKGKADYTSTVETYDLNPQKVGVSRSGLTSVNGKKSSTPGAGQFESAFVTVIPVVKGDKAISAKKNGKVSATFQPGAAIPDSFLSNLDPSSIEYKPVAFYTQSVDAGGVKSTQSFYEPITMGNTSLFPDSEVKSGRAEQILNELIQKAQKLNSSKSQKPVSSGGNKSNSGWSMPSNFNING